MDASSDTVIPGLSDAHSHEGIDQPYAGGRRTRMELAMGITSEISMGDEPYRALEQVESQESGATLGPRYFWGAEPIDGTRICYGSMRADPNMASLTRDLGRIAKLKPDMLKTYVRLPNSYEQIAVQAGHELGLPSFSHYYWPALGFGQDGTSHWATQRFGSSSPSQTIRSPTATRSSCTRSREWLSPTRRSSACSSCPRSTDSRRWTTRE